MRAATKTSLTLVLCAGAIVNLSCSSKSTPADTCVEPESGLPTDVFCTGLYADHDPTQHSADALAYTPGVALWSDGAEKHRYLYLPPATTIDTSNLDAWKFPVGTKAWKEFRVDGVLVETRLFWKRTETAWDSGTYVWDAAGTTATLNTDPKGIILPSGYEIPKQKDCDKCHHGGSDRLLGIEAVALALPRAEGATLTVLAQRGALSKPPSTTTIALPEDASGKAGAALGYLHANCGMPCHSSRGLGDETKLVLRLRAGELWPDGSPGSGPAAASMTDTFKSTVNQDPTTAAVAQAFAGAHRITPGAHDKSLVWLVSHLRGNYQMPPLVSHRIDDVGTQQLADWIDALPK
jgi:hypothetical protein